MDFLADFTQLFVSDKLFVLPFRLELDRKVNPF